MRAMAIVGAGLLLAAPALAEENRIVRDALAVGLAGQIEQEGFDPYEALVSMQGETIVVDYPAFRCGGRWMILDENPMRVTFRETIVRGRSRCVNGGFVDLVTVGDSILFAWRPTKALKVQAAGVLSTEAYAARGGGGVKPPRPQVGGGIPDPVPPEEDQQVAEPTPAFECKPVPEGSGLVPNCGPLYEPEPQPVRERASIPEPPFDTAGWLPRLRASHRDFVEDIYLGRFGASAKSQAARAPTPRDRRLARGVLYQLQLNRARIFENDAACRFPGVDTSSARVTTTRGAIKSQIRIHYPSKMHETFVQAAADVTASNGAIGAFIANNVPYGACRDPDFFRLRENFWRFATAQPPLRSVVALGWRPAPGFEQRTVPADDFPTDWRPFVRACVKGDPRTGEWARQAYQCICTERHLRKTGQIDAYRTGSRNGRVLSYRVSSEWFNNRNDFTGSVKACWSKTLDETAYAREGAQMLKQWRAENPG